MNEYKVTIKNRFMVIPINMNAKRKKICMYDGERLIYDFDAHIDFDTPRYYSYLNVERFRGLTLALTCDPRSDIRFTFVDAIPTSGMYKEEYRPMVHFSAGIGWINDPNGLTYYNGKYHLFFQHNPLDSAWGNMTWGHALSDDLIHWHETSSALYPDETGTMFSGSGIEDANGAAGFGKNTMILYYTAAGSTSSLSAGKRSTQCMAYSPDGGNSFVKYPGNPVIPHVAGDNRDPKIVWCEELGCYLLALYLDGSEYAIFTTTDLIHFTELQRLTLPGDAECPDLYPVRVENEIGVYKWVLMGASDKYLVGDIGRKKGGRFTPSQSVKSYTYGKRTSYAAQSFSGTGDRRIRMAWDVLHAPESVFENQMGVPVEITLVKCGEEYRLRMLPVKEFESLRVGSETRGLDGGFERPMHRKAYDINLNIPRSSGEFGIDFFGYRFSVKPSENVFAYDDVVVPLTYGKSDDINIRIISDTLGCEIFLDNGLIYTVAGGVADYTIRYLTVKSRDEDGLKGGSITVHTLKGIW